MITDFDRRYYLGGSDTYRLMSKEDSKTWKGLVDEKIGLATAGIGGNIYTRAGTVFEHPLLYAVEWDMILDEQLIHDKWPIRVNYDGRKGSKLFEVKTHKIDEPFELLTDKSKGKFRRYWMQTQVEMYVYKEMSDKYFLPPFEKLYVLSYGLYPDEYYREQDDIEIDTDRIKLWEIKYDPGWIKHEYLPRVKRLARILKKVNHGHDIAEG